MDDTANPKDFTPAGTTVTPPTAATISADPENAQLGSTFTPWPKEGLADQRVAGPKCRRAPQDSEASGECPQTGVQTSGSQGSKKAPWIPSFLGSP